MTLDLPDIKRLVREQRDFFASGMTRDVSFRRARLEDLREMILANQERMNEAAARDLHKPRSRRSSGRPPYC